VERARKVFQAAISAYEELTTSIFEPFRELLPTALLLPAIFHGTIRSEISSIGPSIDWYWEPLPADGHTLVDIHLDQAPSDRGGIDRVNNILIPMTQRARELRPRFADIISVPYTQSILEIYGVSPATDMAYDWLKHDLRAIDWTR